MLLPLAESLGKCSWRTRSIWFVSVVLLFKRAAVSGFPVGNIWENSRQMLTTRTSLQAGHFMDYLKFDGTTPTFDVIEKTKEYTSIKGYRSFDLEKIPKDYYDTKNYIFRGPIVGPINRQDLVDVNKAFALQEAFPDLDREAFGFTVDPDNPYRVMFFERWTATHTGNLNLLDVYKAPPTYKKMIQPAFPFSVVWNPSGQIVYEHLTTAVDRFEGNTKGKVAVFGLLETAGISLNNGVGDPILIFQQKFNRQFNPGPGQVYSKKEDIPKWWKSTAVGAEKNDI